MSPLRSINLWRTFLVLLTFLISLSRANYDLFNYDIGATQFAPDGRLLQVEYAAKAATQGDASPILVGQIQSKDEDDTLTVVCTTRQSNSAVDRMVHLTDSDSILILTGLLPDAVRLVRLSVDKAQDDFHRMWGNERPISGYKIASEIAQKCQIHSLGGGIRCFGASIVVIENCDEGLPNIYQTHTSGSVQRYSMREDGEVLLIGDERKEDDSHAGHGLFSNLSSFLEYASTRLLPKEIASEEAEHYDMKRRVLQVSLLSRKHGIRFLSGEEVASFLKKSS